MKVSPEAVTAAIMFLMMLIGFAVDNQLFTDYSFGGVIACAVIGILRGMENGQIND